MTRDALLLHNLVGAGLSTALAEKARDAGFSLTTLKEASRAVLAETFDPAEIDAVTALRRRPIPAETVERLADECDWKCCLCWKWDLAQPVVIHHIESHAKTANDDYDNLVLLCSSHHDQVHLRSDLARPPLPPDLLRARKSAWVEAVSEYRAGRRAKPGHEPPPLLGAAAPVAPPPDFVGRADEMRAVVDHVENGRSVLIHGMGGVGKSAMAAQVVAHGLQGRVVLWGDLGRVDGSASAVLASWIRSCGADPSQVLEEDLVETARAVLSKRVTAGEQVAFVVDDVRTEWAEAAALLKQAAPPGTAVLFTARDAALAGSLSAELLHLDDPSASEALRLLAYVAGDALADDPLSLDLLSTLGHLPLAVELAGRRLAVNARKPGPAVEHLLRAVRESADRALVFPGRRGLSQVFAVTYDALPTHQRQLFQTFGAFGSTMIARSDLAAVQTLLGRPTAEIEADLDALVELALLKWTTDVEVYRIHPLLHQFSSELLTESGDARRVRDAHTEWIRGLIGHDVATVDEMDALEQRLTEVETAVRHLMSTGSRFVLGFVCDLWRGGVLRTRGRLSFVEAMLSDAIGLSIATAEREYESELRGDLGSFYALTGHTERAVEELGRAADLCAELGLRGDEAAHRGNLGLALTDAGREVEADRSYNRALDLALSASPGRPDVAVDQMCNLASAARQRSRGRRGSAADKDRRTALHLYQRALGLLERRGSGTSAVRAQRGGCLSNLGLVYGDMEDYARAQTYVEQGLEIARREKDLRGVANRTGHLANLTSLQGRFEEAIPLYRDAARLAEQATAPLIQATWLFNLGLFRHRMHPAHVPGYSLDDALMTLGEAWSVAESIRHVPTMGSIMYIVAWIHHDQGQSGKANSVMETAADLLEQAGSPLAESAREILRSAS